MYSYLQEKKARRKTDKKQENHFSRSAGASDRGKKLSTVLKLINI